MYNYTSILDVKLLILDNVTFNSTNNNNHFPIQRWTSDFAGSTSKKKYEKFSSNIFF